MGDTGRGFLDRTLRYLGIVKKRSVASPPATLRYRIGVAIGAGAVAGVLFGLVLFLVTEITAVKAIAVGALYGLVLGCMSFLFRR